MIVLRYIKLLFRSFIDFFRDGGLMLAGSMSYFTVMAIVPFCLFLVTIFGYFLGENREFYQFFLSKLTGLFPKITSEITEELKRIITYKGLGKFSLMLYGVLSYQLFASLESSINTIFKVKGRRSFLISLVLALTIVTLIIAFLLISFGSTSAVSILKALKEHFPYLRVGKITALFMGYVVPFVLVFMTVTTMYLLLPRKKVNVTHALSGAIFTAIFLETAKHLFTIYVVKVIKLGTIYGPLSVFVVFLLWVFYSSCIFLIGAEVVRNLGDSKG